MIGVKTTEALIVTEASITLVVKSICCLMAYDESFFFAMVTT